MDSETTINLNQTMRRAQLLGIFTAAQTERIKAAMCDIYSAVAGPDYKYQPDAMNAICYTLNELTDATDREAAERIAKTYLAEAEEAEDITPEHAQTARSWARRAARELRWNEDESEPVTVYDNTDLRPEIEESAIRTVAAELGQTDIEISHK